MKKSAQFLILFSTFSLISCGNQNDSSSSSPKTKQEEITDFLNDLSSFCGSYSSYSYESTLSNNYYAITTDTTQRGTVSLYNSSQVGKLIDDVYTQQIGDNDPDAGETQTYIANDRLYVLYHYDDPNETDVKNVTLYDEEEHANYLSISPFDEEKRLLDGYSDYIGQENYVVSQSFPDLKDNNTFSYSYSVDAYRDGAKEQTISYDNTVTISDGHVTELEREMQVLKYIGKELINSTKSSTKRTYTLGEPQEFEGTVFDPDDFKTNSY